jgi:DNA polymerase bacteriophage-type
MLHVPEGSITKKSTPRERDIGKTADLACGYMGGEDAIEKFAPEVFTLEERTKIKTEWRAAHPRTRRFWYDVDRAAWDALDHPGKIVCCGPIAFKAVGSSLLLRLPSQRKLVYPFARNKRIDDTHGVVMFMDNSAGRWRECNYGRGSYGGIWVENIVQGISRDLLVESMMRVEAAGYPIVMTVHDEIVCEILESFGSTEEFTRLMTRAPSWAPTLPIAAKAWDGKRFS